MDGHSPARELESAVRRLCELEERAQIVPGAELYHESLSSVDEICSAVLRCEAAGMSREDIAALLAPARALHDRAPFVARPDGWPVRSPRADEPTPPTFSLHLPFAQQHRNRVQRQAARILGTAAVRPRDSRILSLACGDAPEFVLIEPQVTALAGEIWLNDEDGDALRRAAAVLQRIRERCHVVQGNALMIAGRLRETFDLVLVGDLLDHLDTRRAACLIRIVWKRLLRDGGTFFFMNTVRGNPYRCLIEFLSDSLIHERSESEILDLCRKAGVPPSALSWRYDESRLTLLIELAK
jgi:SAM-dependent methyltransferase